MSHELNLFLSQYADFTVDALNEILSKFQQRELTKNDFLLQEGQPCNDFVFVQSGCLRMFYINEEAEVSVWFAFANSSAVELSSFISGKPSAYSIQAIEDSTVFYLPKSELNKLYESQPQMQTMMRKFWEDAIFQLLKRFTALQKDSAEKRYTDLMNNTDYVQKIPQKYLASFIGVTPTSLSRIRRNIK
jgi:CRP-like cAMP-binding protein